MSWIPDGEDKKYLDMVASMTVDTILGRGVENSKTYGENLRVVVERFDPQPIPPAIVEAVGEVAEAFDNIRWLGIRYPYLDKSIRALVALVKGGE